MSSFWDFIYGSYFGGLLWLGLGVILMISNQKPNDWRKERTDRQRIMRFLGICAAIAGTLVIINQVYNHFHHV